MSSLISNIGQEIIDIYHINHDDAVALSDQLEHVVDMDYLLEIDDMPMSVINTFKSYDIDTLDLLSLYLQSGFSLDAIYAISRSNSSTVSVDVHLGHYIASLFDDESDSFYVEEDNDPLFIINDDEQVRMSTVLKLVSNMINFNDIAAEALCRDRYEVGMYVQSTSEYQGNVLASMLDQVPGNHHKAIISIDGYDYGENPISFRCEVTFDKNNNTIVWNNSIVRLFIENPTLLYITGVVLRVFNDDEQVEIYSTSRKSLITVPRKHLAAWVGHEGVFNGVTDEDLGDSASIDAITEELKLPEEGVDYLSTVDIIVND